MTDYPDTATFSFEHLREIERLGRCEVAALAETLKGMDEPLRGTVRRAFYRGLEIGFTQGRYEGEHRPEIEEQYAEMQRIEEARENAARASMARSVTGA
jgi:hypothetical protein